MSLADLRDRRAPYSRYRPTSSRLIGFGLVVVFHVVIVYALVNALAHRTVGVVHAPIETKIIDEIKEDKQEPPPPPPEFSPPPPAFVPPPEIRIETAPPPQSSAITAVTTVKPVAPPPVAPKAEPVRVTPKIDLRRSQEPEYPPASRKQGEQGSLTLQVLVDAEGRVRESKLVQSSGFERLDQAALAGVKTSYRFIPGTIDGKPEQMWYTFKFTWKLK